MISTPRRRAAAKPSPKPAETKLAEETRLLLKMVEQLRDDFQEEREASRQSRSKLYERMDGVANDVGDIKGDIRMLGEADQQLRGQIQTLAATVTQNHDSTAPTVEAMRDLLKTGRRFTIVMGFAGLSFAAILTAIFTWFGDTLPTMIKHWLKLG